ERLLKARYRLGMVEAIEPVEAPIEPELGVRDARGDLARVRTEVVVVHEIPPLRRLGIGARERPPSGTGPSALGPQGEPKRRDRLAVVPRAWLGIGGVADGFPEATDLEAPRDQPVHDGTQTVAPLARAEHALTGAVGARDVPPGIGERYLSAIDVPVPERVAL